MLISFLNYSYLSSFIFLFNISTKTNPKNLSNSINPPTPNPTTPPTSLSPPPTPTPMITPTHPIPQQFLSTLNESPELNLDSQSDPSWPQTLSLVKQSRHVSLSIYQYPEAEKLVKSICVVGFTHLEELYLEDNGIGNIEALSFVSAPRLELLYLANNLITNFKPLEKCSFPNLSCLSISNNPTPDFDFMKRTNFHSHLKHLALFYPQPYNADNNWETDLNRLNGESVSCVFLAKVQAREISRLILEGRKFQLIVKICQKLPGLMRTVIETEVNERQFQAM